MSSGPFGRLARWCRRLVWRRAFEEDIRQELESHVMYRADDLMRHGISDVESLRIAHAEFGSLGAYRSDVREASGFRVVAFVESIIDDARYSVRAGARTPAVAAIAVLSLAVGIGANTAVFSVVNAMWFKPLPIRAPQELATYTVAAGLSGIDYPTVRGFMARPDVVGAVAAVAQTDRSNISIGGVASSEDPRPATVHLVSGNYFSLLGVRAARGRTIQPYDDTDPGAHPVVVISDAYRRRRFADDTLVVGRTLRLNDVAYTIVGVAPRGFVGDVVGGPADLWIPIAMTGQVVIDRPNLLTNPNPPWVRMLTRIPPGSSLAAMQQRATALYRRILEARLGSALTADQQADVMRRVMLALPAAHGFTGGDDFAVGSPLTLVWAIVLMLLVLSCTNVAGLLLGRAVTREREIATRAAIGARRARIVRQLMTESATVAAAGSLIGVGAAFIALPWVARAVEASRAGSFDLAPDSGVLITTLVTCVAATLIAGIVPAVFAGRGSLTSSLNAKMSIGGRRLAGAAAGRLLVIGQVALSLTLVVSASLFTRSLSRLRHRDIGLDTSNLMLVWTAPMQAGIVGDQLATVYDAATARVAALPGVRSVAASSRGLLNDVYSGSPIRVPGYTPRPDDDVVVQWNLVTPSFFETTGIRLLAGRPFTIADDSGAQQVAIISRAVARHYFGSVNPIGRRFGLRRGQDFPLEIVGVAEDAIDNSLHATRGIEMVYLPYRQSTAHLTDLCLMVRTNGAASQFASSVRRALHDARASLPVVAITSVDEQLAQSLARDRVISAICDACAALAFLLALIGLYAVVAQSVASRRAEFAVRLALGASPAGVIGLVLGGSLRLIVVGVALGCGGAILAGNAFGSQLFEVGPHDPASIGAATVLLLVTGALAALGPAVRAARANPYSVLRLT